MPSTLRTLPGPRGVQATLALTLLFAGCNGSTGPQSSGSPVQFSRSISFPDLQARLAAGPARVEVRLEPGGLVARSVTLRRAHGPSRTEEIRGRVSAIDVTGDQGTLTFEPGGLEVGFGTATRVTPRGGKGRGGQMGVARWVARVQADLDAGRHPSVRALRSPASEPQDPGDATFMASDLKLNHGADLVRLELNVTAANLVANQTPPPDGWLKVLGLSIELRASDGETSLEAELPAADGAQEFAGIVRSVDAAAGTVTLQDGRVVTILAGTRIEQPWESLADMQAALAAGKTVTAEGEGLADGLTITAVRVEFAGGD